MRNNIKRKCSFGNGIAFEVKDEKIFLLNFGYKFLIKKISYYENGIYKELERNSLCDFAVGFWIIF